jgi:hypothetical protein
MARIAAFDPQRESQNPGSLANDTTQVGHILGDQNAISK